MARSTSVSFVMPCASLSSTGSIWATSTTSSPSSSPRTSSEVMGFARVAPRRHSRSARLWHPSLWHFSTTAHDWRSFASPVDQPVQNGRGMTRYVRELYFHDIKLHHLPFQTICHSTTTFITYFPNQYIAHELIALQVLVLFLERRTDNSVNIAI